jgi:hypothetical protein
LKPEQWGSLLVQEKYQGEKACDKKQQQQQIIIIIIIIIIKSDDEEEEKENTTETHSFHIPIFL